MPNKLSQFWQELKRRNVVRVITVYAAAAFVIIELVDIVAPNLGLPPWTFNLVLILLLVGFVITIIVSWIYDIHPEGGIIKTEPAHKVRTEDFPKSSNSWKIASYISFVVIVGLIVLNIIPRSGRSGAESVVDKSIAVLPFTSLSDDPDKQYQADGVMDAILLHLCKIEDLRVISRTSMEQYRDTDMTINEICEELGVSYILEGSFRRYEDQARLIVQLIQPGREEHVWANNYDRDWKDIFTVESEVAQAVARELRAVITPEVKQRIEKIPTTNLTAYDFYQRGNEEYRKFLSMMYRIDQASLDNAEQLYRKALDYDPSFALAYAGLAAVCLNKFVDFEHLDPVIRDSALFMADKALVFDPQISLAHFVKARYYLMTGNDEQAQQEFTIAAELNPNDYQIYFIQGEHYRVLDGVKSLENLHRAASFLSGNELAEILNLLSEHYGWYGFEEEFIHYVKEALKLGGDSAVYFRNMAQYEFSKGNESLTIEYCDRMLSIHPDDMQNLMMKANFLSFFDQYEESIECYEELYRHVPVSSAMSLRNIHRLGLAYWQTGERDKAQEYFNWRIAYADSSIQLGNVLEMIEYYDLAATYAFLGKKKEALENLRMYHEVVSIPNPSFVIWLKALDPLFEGIRDDPEFQQIVRDVEAKYQAEHERVRQWLEENNI